MEQALVLTGGDVLMDGRRSRADVRVEGGVVAAVSVDADRRDARLLDVTGALLAPGFVELQTNGGLGIDLTSEPERMWELGTHLPHQGVTAFLPTIVTCPAAQLSAAREVVVAGPPPGYRGARVLGLHVEGPMLAAAKRGAHVQHHLRAPSADLVAGWTPEGGVRLVTVAPELPGALEVVRSLRRQGVVVSAGHSEATWDDAVAAFEAGVTFGTHLFNAMPPIRAREPGLAAALLTSHDVSVGVIADGVHVADGSLELAWRARGPERVVLVTDAMAAAGRGDGDYVLGGHEVQVRGPRATLRDQGTLAGSVLRLDAGVRHLRDVTGCADVEAVATVTSNPAAVLGDPTVGRIRVGGMADLTVLEEDLTVRATMVAGDVVAGPEEMR